MKRITVKMSDAKEKLYAADSFFDAMHFGIDRIDKVYYKNYYLSKSEGNLMENSFEVYFN